jgi:AAA domain
MHFEEMEERRAQDEADAKVAEMFERQTGSSRDWIAGAESLLRPGGRAMFFGPKESGKSWAALQLCLQVAAAGGRAVYTDRENGQLRMDERTALLLDGRPPPSDVDYGYTAGFRFRELHDATVMEAFRRWMEEVDLWVIDSAARVLQELGLNETSNADFAKFMGQFVDPVVDGGWTAVLILDNVGYDASHPRGASNKTDLVELAYKVDGGKSCAPHRHGTIRLKKRRDRDGDAADELTMGAGDGKYTPLVAAAPDSKQAKLHDHVVRVLTEHGPVKSKRDVEALLREAQVEVPRRPVINGWLDEWDEQDRSPIIYDADQGGWQIQ